MEAHVDFAKPTTELVTNATDLSSRDHFTSASWDATRPTDSDAFSAWGHFDFEDEEDVDDDMLPLPRAMQEARRIEHSGYRLGAGDQWFAFIEKGMPSNPTVQQLHDRMRHYSPEHLYGTVRCLNNDRDDEPFDMTERSGMRIPGREITIAHMEMPDGVTCKECESGRIQAIRLQRDNGSIETANGTKRDIESTPENADGRAETSSAKRRRRASDGIKTEYSGAPISVDGNSSAKLVPESLQYSDAKVKLELPVEALNTSEALHYQSLTVQQVAAHVALSMHKSAEHAAQAGSFGVRPVQRDKAKSVEPVQHASIEMRVEYGGAMNRGSRARATLTASE